MQTGRRHFLAALTAGSLAGCLGFDSPLGGSDGEPANAEDGPPRLRTDGKWVVDPDGNEVVLRGVNTVDPWWADRYADQRGNSYAETLELATDREAGWYPRVIRIPCQPNSIAEIGVETFASDYLDPAIETCRENDAYAIVDYHTIEPYDTDDVDQRIREFWGTVAPRYADRSHVLYELFNEPTEPYGNGLDSWKRWRETAQPWIDLVREEAPETPIVVGSPEWTSLTRFAPEAPFEGENLIYAGHIYPSDGPDTWEDNYGAPAEEVPVMITEWGYLDVNGNGHDPHMRGTTSGWGEQFRLWLSKHPNVGWAAWCFDSVWDPQMFTAEWDLLGGEYYMGRFTKKWLADARNSGVPGYMTFDEGGDPTAPDDASPPDPPSEFAVDSVGLRSAQVSWTASTDAETSVALYTIYVDDEPVVRVGEKTTASTVSGLTPDSNVELAVTATDVAGNESERSESVTVTTDEPRVHAQVGRAATAPTLDGELTESSWADATAHPLETTLTGTIDGDADLAAEWLARWDDEALYVAVRITDDAQSADSDSAWNDDSVEIYVDADNSKEERYDGENDFQFIVPYDGSGVSTGGDSPPAGDAEQAQQLTPDGWQVEFRLPWSTAGVTPSAGDLVGFDVHVNDDDDGDARDAKLSWFATEDDAWQNPRLFANVELVE